MSEPAANDAFVLFQEKKHKQRRRLVIVAILVVFGGAVIAVSAWIRQSLSPCAGLDITVGLSGCTRVIHLPDFSIEYLAVAPQGDRIAGVGYARTHDYSIDVYPEIRVLEVNNGDVLEVKPADAQGALVPIFFAPDGASVQWAESQLPPLMGVDEVILPDGETRVIHTTEAFEPRLVVQHINDESSLHELPLRQDAGTGMMYVSEDGQRLAGRFLLSTSSEYWLAVWNLTTGEQIMDIGDWGSTRPSLGLAWLPDHRTLAVGLVYKETSASSIAFFDTGE